MLQELAERYAENSTFLLLYVILSSMLTKKTGFVIFLLFSSLSIFARNVKIGYFETPSFMEGAAPDKKKYGYAYEYIEIVAKKALWKVEFVYGNWNDLYEKLLRGEIDILPGVSRTPEREGFILYPDYIMGKESYVVFKRKTDATVNSTDVNSINYRKVGVTKNTLMDSYLKNWIGQRRINPEIVYFEGEEELSNALANGKLSCICTTNNNVPLSYGFAPLYILGSSDYYLAVSSANPEVLRELNQTLARMTRDYPFFIETLQEKYFSSSAYNSQLSVKSADAKVRFRKALAENALQLFVVSFIIIIMLSSFIGIYVFSMSRLRKEDAKLRANLEEKLDIQNSVINVFFTVHVINLKNYEYYSIRSNDVIDNFCEGEKKADKAMRSILMTLTTDAYLDNVMNFINLSTVKERLRGKNIISTEFIGKLNGWCRISFIPLHYDAHHVPEDVIFMVQTIEDEKKDEVSIRRLSRTDQLTGMENKNAYNIALKNYDKVEQNSNCTVFALDLDGLENTNREEGFEAGDEQLVAVASIIKSVFSEANKSFRIGGDEFCVIVNADPEEIQLICQQLDQKISSWQGKLCSNIHISYGYASMFENSEHTVSSLLNLATRRMYDMKRKFYQNKKEDRRHQQ